MKANSRKIAIAFFAIALVLGVWWAAEGAAFFTSTRNMVEVTTSDEIFGDVTTQEWENNFTPGLEIIGPIMAVFAIGGAWIMYRAKRLDRAV